MGQGFAKANLQGIWYPRPGFLVCGGPSLKSLPREALMHRGIVSLGVNNVAGYAPVKAWCFSDGQTKFHHGLYFDPAMMSFVPTPKAKRGVRAKLPDGTFRMTQTIALETPNTWGFPRSGRFAPSSFLTDWFAQWGVGGKQPDSEPHRSFMSVCPECDEQATREYKDGLSELAGNGACKHCHGGGCDRCHRDKRGPTGKCRKCRGVGKISPFSRIATMLLGLRLMHYLGCPRVYLLGVDLAKESQEVGDAYAFDEHGSGGKRHLMQENKMLKLLAPEFKRVGWEVYNCNPNSSCTAFPFRSFEEAYWDCKGAVPAGEFDLEHWYSHTVARAMRENHPDPITEEELAALQAKEFYE